MKKRKVIGVLFFISPFVMIVISYLLNLYGHDIAGGITLICLFVPSNILAMIFDNDNWNKTIHRPSEYI